ncbi:MAG: hypothetical protein ACYSVY_00130 [Planctomycetota bacterium]|jgi:hypothetical protein
MFLSPRAQKAQAEAAGRQNARTAFFDAGPYLTDDKSTVVYPSPGRHEESAAKLKSVGFIFEPGEYPQWTRPTARPTRRNGKVFTPEAWLKSARALYAKTWDWQPPGEEDKCQP